MISLREDVRIPNVLAIDPGGQGAFCFLSLSLKVCFFEDMPTTLTQWDRLFSIIKPWNVEVIVVEDVHSLYGMSARSNFTFGGAVKTANIVPYLASGIEPIKIQPKTWQKLVNVRFPPKTPPNERKKISSIRAEELYQDLSFADIFDVEASLRGPKGGLKDGRVDAFLIGMAYLLKEKYIETDST